jgi:hypothetical protein
VVHKFFVLQILAIFLYLKLKDFARKELGSECGGKESIGKECGGCFITGM